MGIHRVLLKGFSDDVMTQTLISYTLLEKLCPMKGRNFPSLLRPFVRDNKTKQCMNDLLLKIFDPCIVPSWCSLLQAAFLRRKDTLMTPKGPLYCRTERENNLSR